jgi:hypothetical protein
MFSMYNIQICDIPIVNDIFKGSTSSSSTVAYQSILDTGSTCLNLPAEIFDAVVSWIPALQCQRYTSNDINTAGSTLCWIDSNVTMSHTGQRLEILPTLNFALCPTCQQMYLNLTDLIMYDSAFDITSPILFTATNTSQRGHRVCLSRAAAIDQSNSNNFITFGSLTLRSFYVVSDMNSQTVGMVQKNRYGNNNADSIGKNDIIRRSNIGCALPVQCSGEEQYYRPLNTCVPPNCADYIFFDYNSESRSCQLSIVFYVTASILLAFYILGEVGVNEWRNYLHHKVVRTVRHV